MPTTGSSKAAIGGVSAIPELTVSGEPEAHLVAISADEGRGVTVLLKGVRPEHRQALASAGAIDRLASEHHLFDTLDAAIAHARMHVQRELPAA